MRTNLPVSKVEYQVPEGTVLVTKSDLDGTITYCNKECAEVSGYLESELLGQPHNMIRHPDVPQRVFADLWETVASGKAWHGVIKNRRKNGDFYWVEAHVSPLRENGQHIGYVSLRYRANASQIAKAEKHYHSLRDGKLLPLFPHKPDKNYVVQLQQRLAEKIMAQENLFEQQVQEQRIAAKYMDKLIALDKLKDPAVQFYLKSAETFSGDLIAFARTPDNRLHLLLADSTGHGLTAALAAMPMIHPFYSMTGKGFTIQAIAKEINKKIREALPVSHFVAAILASIDSNSRMVEVWSGGCPPPVILDKDGDCIHQFRPRHLAMGILPDEQFDSSVEYYSYDVETHSLMMFSDGLIELENPDRSEQFGLRCLLNAVHIADTDEARIQNVIREIANYGGGLDSGRDDIALIIARFNSHRKESSAHSDALKKSAPQQINGAAVWQFALTLTMSQIKKLDVVPLLLDIVQQIEKDKETGGEIFMILSEMFNNALDHGLLKLDSSLKHHEDGLEKYFDERAARLASVETGSIQLSLKKIQNNDGSAFLRIRIVDSGEGFDHQRLSMQIDDSTLRHGRGIALLRNTCRSVQFFGNGSEVAVEYNLPQETT